MLKIDEGILRPELGAELFPQHDIRRTFEQQPQNLKRLPEEPDSVPVLANLPGARIKLEGSKALGQSRLRRICHDPPRFAQSLLGCSQPFVVMKSGELIAGNSSGGANPGIAGRTGAHRIRARSESPEAHRSVLCRLSPARPLPDSFRQAKRIALPSAPANQRTAQADSRDRLE